MCSGSGAPGNKTRSRGNKGSKLTDLSYNRARAGVRREIARTAKTAVIAEIDLLLTLFKITAIMAITNFGNSLA